jgi:hypothetical protein
MKYNAVTFFIFLVAVACMEEHSNLHPFFFNVLIDHNQNFQSSFVIADAGLQKYTYLIEFRRFWHYIHRLPPGRFDPRNSLGLALRQAVVRDYSPSSISATSYRSPHKHSQHTGAVIQPMFCALFTLSRINVYRIVPRDNYQ